MRPRLNGPGPSRSAIPSTIFRPRTKRLSTDALRAEKPPAVPTLTTDRKPEAGSSPVRAPVNGDLDGDATRVSSGAG